MQESHTPRIGKEEEINIFTNIANKYFPFWPLFVLMVLISLAGAWLYLRYATPVYEINASIMVKDEKKGLDEDKIQDALNMFGNKKIVENEIEVLKSRTLMEEVVKNLGLYAYVIEKGSFRDTVLYNQSPVSIKAVDADSILTSKKLIPFEMHSNGVVLDKIYYPYDSVVCTPWGSMQFNRSKNIRHSVKPLLIGFISLDDAVEALIKELDVSATSKQSTVIELNLKSSIPKKGEDIINNILVEYNQAALNDKNNLASKTLAFVDERLKIVTKELSGVEAEVERYKQKAGIVDLSEQGKVFLDIVKDNDGNISQSKLQLSMLDEVEKYVRSNREVTGIEKSTEWKTNGPTTAPALVGGSNPLLEKLIGDLYETEYKLVSAQKTNGSSSPLILSLKEQVNKIKPAILENLKNARKSLNAGLAVLNQNNNRFQSVLKTIPEKERSLLDISRQQTIKNDLYAFLLQKREETALSYSSAVADNRLIDKAKSTSKPISPVPMMIYLVGFAVGMIASISLLLLKEQFNQEILFRDEIEKATSVPVLAEIQFNPDNAGIVIKDGTRSVLAEQFRTLRTSLSYSGINGEDKKVIMLTSSMPNEGKSFLSLNLASSLSLTGKKVVLLEFDLRKPNLRKELQLSYQPGISEFIIKKAGYEALLQVIPQLPNVFFISSGIIPPNPSEMILHDRTKLLFDLLKKDFDYIVIDTPPMSLVTDASLLGKFADTTLYIIRHGKTPKAFLRMIDEIYQKKRLKNMNIVFNGIKNRGMVYRYNMYGKGYGYGYGEYIKEDRIVKKNSAFKKLAKYFTA